jgi:hypothetical protein
MTAQNLTALTIDGKEYRFTRAVLKEEVAQIDVTTKHEADPNWTFVDAKGHFHAFSINGTRQSLPTLAQSHDDVPCNCQSALCEGDRPTIDYNCLICREEVKPESRKTFGRRYMDGHTSWHIEAEALDVPPIRVGAQVSILGTLEGGQTIFGVASLRISSVESGANGQRCTMELTEAGELGKR